MAIGSIRNRTTGKHPCWQVTLDLGNHPITSKRQRVYKTVYGTKKQAEQELKNMLVSLTTTGSVPTSQPSLLLSDWMEEWMKLYLPHVAETTRRSYEEKTRNHINPMLGHFPINKLTTDKIQGAMNELIGKLSAKSIRNTYNILNAALRKAVQQHYIPYNPCAGVVLNKIPKYEPQVFDAAEIYQALSLADNHRSIYTIIVLGGLLGLRRGELTGLRWENIDFQKKTITIKNNRVNGRKGITEKDPKSESGKRTLSLGDDVLDALRQIKRWYDECSKDPFFRGSGYVLFKDDGSPYAPDSVTQLWTRFVERHNLKKLRLHDLRHTNATLLIAGGADAKTVQHRLGHADISTTVNIKNPYEQLKESKQLDFVCLMKRANHKQTCLRLALFNNYLEFCCTILSYSEQRVSSRIGFFNSHSQTVSTFQPCEERFSATRLSRAILVLIFSSQNSVFVFGITKYLQFV